MRQMTPAFWQKVKAETPKLFKHFSAWIDQFKAKHGWDTVFIPGVKFHDLPDVMQMSILAIFVIEFESGHLLDADIPRAVNDMKDNFSEIEQKLK